MVFTRSHSYLAAVREDTTSVEVYIGVPPVRPGHVAEEVLLALDINPLDSVLR